MANEETFLDMFGKIEIDVSGVVDGHGAFRLWHIVRVRPSAPVSAACG